MATAPPACRHCGAPLGELDRRLRKPHCGAATCRQALEAEALRQRWQAVAAVAVERVGDADRSKPPPAVLWLRPVSRELEPVTQTMREALAAAWLHGLAEGWRHASAGFDSALAPAATAALCVQCGGRCCTHGAKHHAFIDADVLARWVADHPARSSEDAVADYLARLPTEHVKDSCAFHGAQGCTLPRERRGDVCNHYVCEPFLDLAETLRQDPGRAAVALTSDGRRLERAALLQRGRITSITGLPQPDDLPPPA